MKIQKPLRKTEKKKSKKPVTSSHNYLFLTDYSIIYKEMRKKKNQNKKVMPR